MAVLWLAGQCTPAAGSGVPVEVTDEEDLGKSAGNPASWYSALVNTKGGSESAVVVLGLMGDLDLPTSICDPLDDGTNVGAEASPNLRAFVDMFDDFGLDASVCADDYRPFFEEAVRVIDQACDDFIPPG